MVGDLRARIPSGPVRLQALFVSTVLLFAACAGGGGGGGAGAGGGAAAYPSKDISIMAPAAPGGGWDSTARAMQKAMKDAKVTDRNVEVYNVEGAGGTVGLAQFVEQKKGDPHQLMVMGLVMVGAIRTNKSPVDLTRVTPVASLTTEWEAIAVKADSKYRTFQDLVTDFKANPKSISWAGGSAGGTDHILVALIAKAAGVQPADINYVPHSGGGEALAAILSGAASAGVSGASEFEEQVKAGQMRLLAVSSDAKLEGIDTPTIKESGLDVVLPNWRGVMAPPDISPDQRNGIVALLQKMHDSQQWQGTLKERGWQDFFKTGDEFKTFVDQETQRIEGVLKDIGLTG
jgi:putative tricarboxylic transport membrane protein